MIALVDYGAGNICSVQNALCRLGVESILTAKPELIQASEKVIFPGVGEASTAMKILTEKGLDTLIPSLNQPVLGICLGMQLLCTSTEEGAASLSCLKIFDTEVKRFPEGLNIPHMGWNNCTDLDPTFFEGITSEDDFYFVHSYAANVCSSTIATCDYGIEFSAALRKNNFYATQFHPEKSSDKGEIILQNFLDL